MPNVAFLQGWNGTWGAQLTYGSIRILVNGPWEVIKSEHPLLNKVINEIWHFLHDLAPCDVNDDNRINNANDANDPNMTLMTTMTPMTLTVLATPTVQHPAWSPAMMPWSVSSTFTTALAFQMSKLGKKWKLENLVKSNSVYSLTLFWASFSSWDCQV